MRADLAAARERFLASGDDAELPIVDAHHHFFDLARNPHPWLQRLPRIPFRYGDYGPICRDWLPADHAAAAGRHRVMRSVLMEGEWDPADPTGEARWVQSLADTLGTPQALAAQAWLDRDDLPAVLAAYRTLPIVRSVRHKPRSLPRAEHHAGWQAPGSMRCPRWRDGYARLEAAGLMFELQAPVVDALLARFGSRRCLFASNFPVDGLVAPLATIFDGFKALTRCLPPAERLALFCDNAVALYRLD